MDKFTVNIYMGGEFQFNFVVEGFNKLAVVAYYNVHLKGGYTAEVEGCDDEE